ncbi:uncharacterized protein LOC116204238 [Punica granatum]|uniref:Uncharacterized protein LOC116204238 n=1 Tax=Punica granatum TaxID=22663 RepID=A0A6P8DKJ7_PUNGR|nr:uncharacterized protein LOC116204238 [Punica granatum]
MEGPTGKGEESSKNVPATSSSSNGRRGKEVSVNAINPAHQTSQQYSVNLTTTPTTAPAYFPPPPQHQPQSIYYSAPPVPPPMASQPYDHHYAFTSAPPPQPRSLVSRAPPPAQQNPTPQDQSKRCEYHQGAPGHTLDNCWRLRDEIQKRIDSNRLTFNAVRPSNVHDNPLPDHRPSSGPSINMITICTSGRDEDAQDNPLPFVIDYTPEEPTVGFAGHMASPAPFVVDIPAREPYSDNKVPWTYEGGIGNVEQQFSVMGVTLSGRVYENPAIRDKGKAPATEVRAVPGSSPFPSKRVTEEEAEAFMKVIKASEYKVVEQMAKSPAHISLLTLLLSSEPHQEALLRVLTEAQVPKEMPPDRIEETVGCIFSNTISFSDDELPSEGWTHSRALHIVYKCNNYIIGRVMIDNGSALNVCPVTTLKQMNVDLNRVRPSKTAVRAFDGSRREVNGEIDLLIDVGPCSFSITFQVLYIPNALHPNPNPRHFDSNPFKEHLGEPQPVYFGEGLPEDSQVLEIEESLRRLEDHQITSVEPPEEEINMGTEEEPRTVKFGTAVDPAQRTWMIDFLKEYQEVFAWSYADMSGLDPSIVEHFLPLDTEKFPPKRQQLRRQRASLLLRIKEEVVKQINVGFLEVCN